MESAALLDHRILILSEPITPETSRRLVAQLLLLDAADSASRIDLYINSPGGSVTDGLAILDALHCIRAPVSTICIGQAASMAAWILAAGRRGQRFATPNAEVMIHQLASGFSGQTAHVQVMTQRMLRLQQKLVDLLAEFTGQPPERIQRDMEKEYYMPAEEALNYGMIDQIVEPCARRSE